MLLELMLALVCLTVEGPLEFIIVLDLTSFRDVVCLSPILCGREKPQYICNQLIIIRENFPLTYYAYL